MTLRFVWAASAALLLAGCLGTAFPRVGGSDPAAIHDAVVRRYPVTGPTAADLRRQLDATGPVDDRGVRRDGLTHWELRWEPPAGPGSCVPAAVRVEAEVIVTLPEWQAAEGADADLRRRWEWFLYALASHEQGHVDVVRKAMPDVRRALVAAACTDLDGAGRRQVERLRALQDAYDERTAHGRNDGVAFP
jgi:predicted secreted Zn-dependent protease